MDGVARRGRRYCAYLAARAGLGLLAAIPLTVRRALSRLVVGTLVPLATRRDACQSLTTAFGGAMTGPEQRSLLARLGRHVGSLVAECLELDRLTGDRMDGLIDAQAMRQAVQLELGKGRGLVLLSGHIGNWEALSPSCARVSAPRSVSVVAKRHSNPRINGMIEGFRARCGVATFYQDESPRTILRYLQAGNVVGILPDQDVAALKGIFVDFFGRPAYTPIGPAWFALHAGVPIVPMFAIREGNRLRVHMEPTIYPDTDAPDKDAEIQRLTVAWSAAVERVVRQWPDQWMWFHRRWRTTPERLRSRNRGRNVRGPGVESQATNAAT